MSASTLGRRAVVRDVSATFAPGTLTGIVGPNGAGKSTLARAMLALVPASGTAEVDGVNAAAMPRAPSWRGAIAYVPQGQTLHWPLTVERLVGLGRLPHLAPMSRISGRRRQAAIERAMARADVLELRDRIATELSGRRARARTVRAGAGGRGAGADRRRTARASLDPGHQIDVMDMLRAETAGGALVIAVLHDLTLAARYCDRLLLIDEGRIVADGTPAEVLTAERLRAVYGIDAAASRRAATGRQSRCSGGRAVTAETLFAEQG